MSRILKFAALVAAFLAHAALLGGSSANAQGITRLCTQSIGAGGSNNCTDVSSSNPLPVSGVTANGNVNIHDGSGNVLNSTGGALNVSGTFTATLGGFTPSSSGARMTQIAVLTSDSSGTLPTGAVVVVSDTGATNPMYCNVNGVTATTSDQLIPAGSWFAFTIPNGVTTLHCIATGGSTTANGLGGSGLPNGSGGGGGGGVGGATNVQSWNGTTVVTGHGTATGALRVELPTDGTGQVVATQSTAANLNMTEANSTSILSAVQAGTAAPGAGVPSTGVMVAGSDGTDLRYLATDTSGNLKVASSPYPATAVPITASATGTTAATTATLTNVSGHTTYICGFSIRANATAAVTNNATITGTISGTMNFTQWTAPLASGLGITENAFAPCIPASAVSTSIAVVSGAPGSGGVVSVSAWGYSL